MVSDTLKVGSRPMSRMEEVPIPQVGIPQVTQGPGQQRRPQPLRQREVLGLQPRQL